MMWCEICIGCCPRNSDGSCPDAPKSPKKSSGQSTYSDIVSDGGLDPRNKADAQHEHNHLSDAMSVLADVNADLIAEAKLAQSEQKPVAWQFYQGSSWHIGMDSNDHRKNTESDGYLVRDLYTVPPKREWQGLTDEEVDVILKDTIFNAYEIRAIETMLKEKNT